MGKPLVLVDMAHNSVAEIEIFEGLAERLGTVEKVKPVERGNEVGIRIIVLVNGGKIILV